MNLIKTTQEFPDVLKYCNIARVYKNKGSRKEFCNYRGIFCVTVLKSILDKLLYNDDYSGIDVHLTDSNVGARKKRNVRDVMNRASKRRLKNIAICIYDAEK